MAECHRISDRHKQSLEFALTILKSPEYFDYITRIYLFGSCARGQEKYDSDIDLLICVKTGISPKVLRKIRTDVVADDYTLPEVELKFMTDAQSTCGTQFIKNIREEAILLWENP